MTRYEYKVIPAPLRGQKARGVKTADARFALALETALNAEAGDGWSYVRAETLPSEERQGLTGSTTTYRNVLIFRREIAVHGAVVPEQSPPLPFEHPATPDDTHENSSKDDEIVASMIAPETERETPPKT